MMHFLRALLLGGALFFGLGCMGMVNDLVGLDLEMAMGENSIHPADFEVRAPSTGNAEMSMSMTTDAESVNLPNDLEVELTPGTQYYLELISYENVDLAAETALAIQSMEGTEYVRQDDIQGYASFAKPDGTLFLIAGESMLGSVSLLLIRLTPKSTPPVAE